MSSPAKLAFDANPAAENIGPAFREAMRCLALSVAVVTTRHDGLCHGMTATAISSLTMDPPALLVCINRAASIHGPLLHAGAFCINLLGTDQQHVSAAFSGAAKGQERFAFGDWQTDDAAMPYLRSAAANIFCILDQSLSYGTHDIFIGRVNAVRVDASIRPIVYHNGLFGQFEARA